MTGLAVDGDKRLTLRQVAEATGASYRTVADYAKKAGWTENGKKTLLDEKRAAIIVEAMKAPKSSGRKSNLAFEMQGIETALSPALKLELLYRQIDEIKSAEIVRLNAELTAANSLIDHQAAGLETIQRIAEAGGLVMSDRDDIESMYRGRR
jgi:hypothetical protein